jgi:hypothetical protein
MSQHLLKEMLMSDYAVPLGELKHAESGRPLSTVQLLALLEDKLKTPGLVTKQLRALSELRVVADHKVLEAESATKSYSREFAEICGQLAQALGRLAKLFSGRTK